MSQLRYWKADSKTSAQIIEWVNDWNKKVRAARRLAKSIGAERLYLSSGTDPQVIGFAFASPPNRRLFVRLKNTLDGWKPRSGSELFVKIREFACEAQRKTMELVGIERGLEFVDGGFQLTSVGIHVVGKTAYLSTRINTEKMRGCMRISDIQYERATKKSK